MANYKVPQDVEAEDKLLGPFSFRQFIYLLIVVAAIGVAFVLFRILPPLVIIPLPVVLFFGALALPLRKDQPMEIYLAAILSFYLKPRQRMWEPDGIETLVHIAAPRNKEPQRTKNVSASEAEQRLRYLSDLSDSRGWSVRNTHAPVSTSMNADVFNEAQQTQDILDTSGSVAQNFNQMITQNDQRRHQQVLSQFQAAAAAPAPAMVAQQPIVPQFQDPYANLGQQTIAPAPPQQAAFATPSPNPFTPTQITQPAAVQTPADTEGIPQFNPYPTNMNQTVIQPLSDQQATQQPAPPVAQPEPTSTSTKPLSPDIINLANNTDLSIETIAREANRISEKEAEQSNEVIISLR